MSLRKQASSLARKPAVLQGSAVVLDQGILSLATFLIGVLVARSTSKDEYGIYVLGWSLLMIFQSAHRGLIMLPFTVYVSRQSRNAQNSYKGSVLIHTLVICATIIIGLLGISHVMANKAMPDTVSVQMLLPVLSVLLVPFLLRELLRGILLAQLRVFESLIPNIMASFIFIALVVGYFVVNELTYSSPFMLLALTSALAVAIMGWNDRSQLTIRLQQIWPDFQKNWKIGKWMLVNLVAFAAAAHSYLWLLLFMLGSESVAAFGACAAVAGLLAPFLRGATSYILPRMSHSYDGKDARGLIRILRLSTMVLAIPYGIWLLAGGILGDRLITLIYSPEYQGYGLLFILLLIKTTVEGMMTPLTSALQALEKPHITTQSLVLGAAVALVAGYALINRYGLTGAGMAAMMSSSVMAGYKWWAIRRLISAEKIHPKNTVDTA